MSTDGLAADFAAVFCTNAKNVLKAALGRAIQCSASEHESPLELLPGEGLLRLQLKFTGAVEGAVNLILTESDAAVLADLLMMGDGTSPWNDEQLDALKEIGNQLAGSLATNQGERWGASVSNGGAMCEHWELEEVPGLLFPIALDVQGATTHPMVLWLEPDLCGSLRKREEDQSLAAVTEALAGLNLDFGAPVGAPKPAAPVPPPPVGSAPVANAPAVTPVGAPSAGGVAWVESHDPALSRLLDIPIEVNIELGKTELSIRRVLEIGPGSIIELDRTAGEPVDLVVNEKIIARGEVVVIDENFGIRITSLVSPEERIRQLR
jgi:flagellar motor switch protein FliN/FliY